MQTQTNRVRELRAKAHGLGQETLHHPANCQVTGGCYLCTTEALEQSSIVPQRQVTLVLVGTMKWVMATLRAGRHIKGSFWRSQ